MDNILNAIETLSEQVPNSTFFDNLVGKLTLLCSKKNVRFAEMYQSLLNCDFLNKPTMAKLIEIITEYGPKDPRASLDVSEIAGGYNIDAGAFSFYFDETSSRGHIVTLEDAVITKKQKDRLQKINANVQLSVPRFPSLTKRLSIQEMGDLVDAATDIKKINPPILINTLVKANVVAAQYPLNWDQIIKKEPALNKLPLWKFDETNETTYVSYFPMYKTHPADLKLLIAARAYIAVDGNSDRALYVYSAADKLRKIMVDYTYCNGTLEGQLNRYRIVAAVADKCRQLRGNQLYRGLNENFAKGLELKLPLLKNHVEFDVGPIEIIRRYGAQPEKFLKPPLVINMAADAGMLYGRSLSVVVRKQSQFADVDLAQLVYDMYGAKSKKELESSQSSSKLFIKAKNVKINEEKTSVYLYSTDDLAKIFNTSRLCKLKPKAEIYSREELTTKTRNFSVQNAGFSNLAMMFFSQPFFKAPKWYEHKTSMSMLGWSPFYGGMTTVVNLYLDKDSHVWTLVNGVKMMKPLVYADNFWCAGEHEGEEYWYSVDGIKAEAHVTINDCKYLVDHCSKSYAKISRTWMRYMKTLYPILCVNSVGVLTKSELPCDFLGSGSPGTAYLNTVATIDYVSALQNNTSGIWKEVLTKDNEVKLGSWEVAEKTTARTFKVEMKVKRKDFDVIDSELKIDLLGYSCVSGRAYGMHGHWIPILDSTRLYKAICFLKSDLSAGEDSSPITLAINFFRYRVFYALGGWFDPGLAAILQTRCQALKKQLATIPSNTKLSDEMQALAQSLSFEQIPGNEYLIKFGSAINIPTMYDVVELTVGNEGLQQFVNWCFNKSKGKPWTYLPYPIFMKEALIRGYMERPSKIIFGDDTSGELIDTQVDVDVYEAILAKIPDWGSSLDNPDRHMHDWSEVSKIEARVKEEMAAPAYKGEEIPVPHPGKNLLSDTSQGDVVSGRFSLLPPQVRKEIGTNLSPILSSILRTYTLYVDNVDDAATVIQTLKRIATYMETPLSIVKNALAKRDLHHGTYVKIPAQFKEKYQLTEEYRVLKDALRRLDLPSSTPDY